MESNSESLIIIQMLKNIKEIINISKGRGCWNDEELKDIGITYHNVCEIVKQLQAKQPQESKRFEEIKEQAEQPDDKKLDESVEQVEDMDEVD
jgi:hypothetical protein